MKNANRRKSPIGNEVSWSPYRSNKKSKSKEDGGVLGHG